MQRLERYAVLEDNTSLNVDVLSLADDSSLNLNMLTQSPANVNTREKMLVISRVMQGKVGSLLCALLSFVLLTEWRMLALAQ